MNFYKIVGVKLSFFFFCLIFVDDCIVNWEVVEFVIE